MNEWIYADGSGNRYRIDISRSVMIYEPVRPENSSSGVYSGGEPVTVILTEEDKKNLKRLAEDAVLHTEDHIPDRVMMSGMIIEQDGSKPVILRQDSPRKKAIETLLLSLRNRGSE